MKKVIQTLCAVFILNGSAMAQSGFKLTKEITINVPAEKLWEMVGPGFIDVYKWSSNVDHAEGRGNSPFEGAVCSERYCDVNVKGFNKISEELTDYNSTARSLTYAVRDGMPKFVTKAENNWVVIPVNDGQSKLVMNATFESKGLMGRFMNGMMEKKMTETLETVLNDAKIYAETGEVSENKARRMAKIAAKRQGSKIAA